MDSDQVPRGVWWSIVAALCLLVAGGVILAVALANGFNATRPSAPPDWTLEAPLLLEVQPGQIATHTLIDPGPAFTMEVLAEPHNDVTLNGYGIIYHAPSATQYEIFAIGADGYYTILQVVNGAERPRVAWQQFPHIRRGQQTNRLRVTCTQQACCFFINDEYVTALDAQDPGGAVGLWVRGFDAPAQVQFEHVSVWYD